MKFERGSVVLADLDPTLGHEQRGTRPCVVVTDPDVLLEQNYPVLCIVPLTGTPGEGALYPFVAPDPAGLRKPSCALTDQIRSVDKRRVRRVFGRVSEPELHAIEEGIRLFLGLVG